MKKRRGWYIRAVYPHLDTVHLLEGPFATKRAADALIETSTKHPAYRLEAEFVSVAQLRAWRDADLLRRHNAWAYLLTDVEGNA